MESVNSIMSNIYGVNATQMMGGSKLRKVKSRGGEVTFEEVAFPEYISNGDFVTFMREFYLVKKISHTYASCIYVIPPKKELEEMIKDFKNVLKKEKIEEKTSEAIQYSSSHDLPYKRCIFNVFADSESDKYRLDNKITYKNFGTVKRTNMLNEQYYFKYLTEYKIEICSNEKSKGEVCNLIAKCNNGIYVFQGKLPKAELIYERKLAGGSSLCGGSLADNRKRKFITQMLEENENNASEIIGTLSYNQTKKALKDYSGDLIHSVMMLAFDDEIEMPDEEPDYEDIDDALEELNNNYSIVNKEIKTEDIVNQFKNAYYSTVKKSLSPVESSKHYINLLKNKYKNLGIPMMKADIATALYRNGFKNDVESIFNLIDEIDEPDLLSNTSKLEFSDNTASFNTSKLNYLINSALCDSPVSGMFGKMYYPLEAMRKRKPKKRRNLKVSKMVGGGDDNDKFEDIEVENENSALKEVGDEEVDELDEFI